MKRPLPGLLSPRTSVMSAVKVAAPAGAATSSRRSLLLLHSGSARAGSRCLGWRSECLLPSYLAWLAETYGRLGRPREGLDLVAEALAAATASGNHYWTAELYRLRGALTETEKDAESSLLEAMAIAQRQRAKSFELRAATSSSQL